MARFSIAYAHSFGQPDTRYPLAVIAQDDQGVTLEGVPQDVEALARSLDLPSQTFVAWVAAKRHTLTPLQSRSGEAAAVTDPVWLERYVTGGNEGTYTFGPIAEAAGSAAEVAKQQAVAIRAQG